MIRLDIIEMTNPDKPTGKNQRKSAQTLRLDGFFPAIILNIDICLTAAEILLISCG